MLGAKQMETLRRAVLNPPAPDGTVFKDCADCPSMVSISGDGGLADFAIGQTEVTQGQWQAVMGRNPSYFTACGADCPVEQVSWDDAQQFIQRLNAKTGKSYRLPTEQEWEYACLAGEKTEYCGGNNVNAVAWWGAYADPVGNSGKTTNRVAGKQANAWGLYDMSGNVYEWTANCYDSGCDSRVLRGGSWYDFPQDVRSANRSNNSPGFRSRFIGFRLARTAP